jgi:hypothetical protein
MNTMNEKMTETMEQGMAQMKTGAEQMRAAGQTWAEFWSEQTRVNLESAMAWQKQGSEMISSLQGQLSKLGAEEKARMSKLGEEFQSQWKSGSEQVVEMAKSLREAGQSMVEQGQSQMAEMASSFGIGEAEKSASKAKKAS